MLVGGRPLTGPVGTSRGGGYRLDEPPPDGLSLAAWALQAALPDLGELTPTSFAAYAATRLPMLIAFVPPRGGDSGGGGGGDGGSARAAGGGGGRAKGRRAAAAATADRLKQLEAAMLAVGQRFRGKLCAVTCDGEAQRTRMIALGLDADGPLPQLAVNTLDGQQVVVPPGTPHTEAALSRFVTSFLREALPPPPKKKQPPPPKTPPPRPASPSPSPSPLSSGQQRVPRGGGARPSDGRGGASTERPPSGEYSGIATGDAAGGDGHGRVVAMTADTFDRVAMDVRSDVLLLLHSAAGCAPCERIAPYMDKVAEARR